MILEETIQRIKGYASCVCQYYLTDTLTDFSFINNGKTWQWVVTCLMSKATQFIPFGYWQISNVEEMSNETQTSLLDITDKRE